VLKHINLSYSKIFKIADLVFKLPTLLDVNLSGNSLTSLSASVFDGAVNLQVIDLSHNKIKNIEPETFLNLRSLMELNLSFNEIHNNSFNQNGVDWTEKIESLRALDLSHNKIFYFDVMPYQAFSGLLNLETLNLRSNEITIDYGVFASNHILKTLDFSFNKMTYFDLNFLMSVSSLENLFIHGNGIAYASQIELSDVRATFTEIKSLGISENSFSCEVLGVIIKKMLKASIQLVVEDEMFVNDRRNLRGVSCI
jgi:Leucine-rich repeat (LRR) protein